MAYTRVNWENLPSTNTPRNATNLNVMDAGIEEVDTRLSTVETNQGTLANLTTTEKTNLVGAINEIKSVVNENDTRLSTVETNQGTLANLTTTNKNNLVNAINEVNTNDIIKGTYSTTETAIGTWINGKTLYRRTFTGNVGTSSPEAITNDINATNCDYINIYGYIGDTTRGMSFGCYINTNWFSGAYINNTQVQAYIGPEAFSRPYALTIEYTKR